MPVQKTERATLSIELLCQLRSIEYHGWQFIITLDKSWFYLSTDHGRIWLRAKEQLLERPKYTIQDPKMMVTIAWNPLGFHLLDALSKGNTSNAEYYRLTILIEHFPLRPQVDGRGLIIYADNARPHTARKYRAFVKKIGSASPYAHHTQRISHNPTSFPSDTSKIVCRESLVHHVRNYLQQFMISSSPSRDQP
jgi:hypothetical protein